MQRGFVTGAGSINALMRNKVMALRPDYGTRFKNDGHDSPHVEHVFYGLPIWGFDALGRPGQYTLTVDAMYAGERHCLSPDFGSRPLAAL